MSKDLVRPAHLIAAVGLLLAGFVAGTAWESVPSKPQSLRRDPVVRAVAPRVDLTVAEQATIQLFELALERRSPGETVRLALLRSSQRVEVDVVLDEPR